MAPAQRRRVLSRRSALPQRVLSKRLDDVCNRRANSLAHAHVTLEIFGLGCGGGGALTVDRQLARIPGVVRAYVNPATETAYIEYDTTQVDPKELAAAVERVGFHAGTPVLR
jgi:copper chaperone CopZ